ncbi:CRP/FNR family cyclic AMP-dependent transcriptional regulator [Sphingomonas sp. UYAg733]
MKGRKLYKMYERFKSNDRLRIETIAAMPLVGENEKLAREIDEAAELIDIPAGNVFIEQGGEDNDVYLILAGICDVVINGRVVAKRGPGTHVGEMAVVQPTQKRSATCLAADDMVVLKLSEPAFAALGAAFPEIYRAISKELARRLLERNATIGAYHDKIRVFIISSAEALPVARLVQDAFEHDPFLTVIWTDGVFKVANYPLSDLEAQIDQSDFAVAIAHADDLTESRGKDWPSPRDNVVFELGLFMGRLSRARAILMEPREEKVKLPSDLTGITTITYRYEPGADAAALLAPACNRLREHILALGPNNG